ncbi:hydroxyacid dehydrogenase [Embleya sp. NBC_00896]|uniref:hydroxyacid dehydrogenase n=1 Tax=Embleya sp. NBC_00896 TaxID=2975961 RepID=UPI002F9141EB|nr:hydroxyacid dehydrogenase [Embleya sp. NBC_00896]
MAPSVAARILDADARARLSALSEVDLGLIAADFDTPKARAALADAEVLFTCWGAARVDEAVLTAAPRLRAVVHAAGSVKHHLTDACWERGLIVSSGAAVNALPVAEYTVASVLFANKRVLQIRDAYRTERRSIDWDARYPGFGNYRRTIGIVGASRIGRRVLELLRAFDFELLVHDPYLTTDQATALGARRVDLDELVRRSDVVSVHAPELASTRHLLDRRRLALMPDGATLINTARGSLVDQEALTAELAAGRLHAVIDVTEPDVLPAESPLYELPNVLLTPHIAGSLGGELRRMVEHALDELERYTRGVPFAYAVEPETLTHSA